MHPGENNDNNEFNSELSKVLQDLKFIVAHRLRAPISSASGLLILLSSDNCSKEDKERILGFLFSTIKEMDDCTREVMYTLVEAEKVLRNTESGECNSGDHKK